MASLWFELGAGLGGMQQEIDYSLDVIAGDEAEVVLAYEVFGGLFYLPTDHSIVGLWYVGLVWVQWEAFFPPFAFVRIKCGYIWTGFGSGATTSG